MKLVPVCCVSGLQSVNRSAPQSSPSGTLVFFFCRSVEPGAQSERDFRSPGSPLFTSHLSLIFRDKWQGGEDVQ